MGIIPTANVKGMRGLHLFHASISNCSQKVRLSLDEKGLPWESHEVDLTVSEHLTPEFLSINPRGLVPVLVHDGIAVNESSDILHYLDTTFPDRPLSPADPQMRALMNDWLRLWDETQPSLKTVTHGGRLGAFRRASGRLPIELAMAQKNGLDNPQLLEFLAELGSAEGLSAERIVRAQQWIAGALAQLDNHLTDHDWLAGDAFCLADIAWSIDVHRFVFLEMPLHPYPSVRRWYDVVRRRDSFQRMVIDYEQIAVRRLAALAEARVADDGAL